MNIVLIVMTVFLVVALLYIGFCPAQYNPECRHLFEDVGKDYSNTWQYKVFDWCLSYVKYCLLMVCSSVILGSLLLVFVVIG